MKRIDREFRKFQESGDARALGRIFDLSIRSLWRVAAHLAGDKHEAEESKNSASASSLHLGSRS